MQRGHPSKIMAEIAALTPGFEAVGHAALDEPGSMRWPATAANPAGTPMVHVDALAGGGERCAILAERGDRIQSRRRGGALGRGVKGRRPVSPVSRP